MPFYPAKFANDLF